MLLEIERALREQFVIGQAAPEEKSEFRGEGVIVAGGFRAEEEFTAHQDGGEGRFDAAFERVGLADEGQKTLEIGVRDDGRHLVSLAVGWY